jgi:hypothetical protein
MKDPYVSALMDGLERDAITILARDTVITVVSIIIS